MWNRLSYSGDGTKCATSEAFLMHLVDTLRVVSVSMDTRQNVSACIAHAKLKTAPNIFLYLIKYLYYKLHSGK